MRRMWRMWARNDVQMVPTISWTMTVDSTRFFRGDAIFPGFTSGLENVRTRCSGESCDGSSFCSAIRLLANPILQLSAAGTNFCCNLSAMQLIQCPNVSIAQASVCVGRPCGGGRWLGCTCCDSNSPAVLHSPEVLLIDAEMYVRTACSSLRKNMA